MNFEEPKQISQRPNFEEPNFHELWGAELW